jgi:hypothetical protein
MPIFQFADKHLQCIRCRWTFVFSAGEQELLHLRGLTRQPPFCPACLRLGRQRGGDTP